jgi:hypothetical protein
MSSFLRHHFPPLPDLVASWTSAASWPAPRCWRCTQIPCSTPRRARASRAAAVLLPLALAATIAGVALVRRIDAARYYTVIYVLMVLLGLKLLTDAVT